MLKEVNTQIEFMVCFLSGKSIFLLETVLTFCYLLMSLYLLASIGQFKIKKLLIRTKDDLKNKL